MPATLITSITTVFTQVGTWLVTFINSVIGLFWAVPSGGTEHELTFLGVLSLMSLAIAIFLLFMNWIMSIIKFR